MQRLHAHEFPRNDSGKKEHDMMRGTYRGNEMATTFHRTADTAINTDCESNAANHYAVLQNVTAFTDAAVGVAGTKPKHYSAYECVLESKQAASILIELVHSKNVPAQLYGLMGLYAVAPAQYQRFKKQFQNSTVLVNTIYGCTAMQSTVSGVVEYIESFARDQK
jgi:hypothetical protein